VPQKLLELQGSPSVLRRLEVQLCHGRRRRELAQTDPLCSGKSKPKKTTPETDPAVNPKKPNLKKQKAKKKKNRSKKLVRNPDPARHVTRSQGPKVRKDLSKKKVRRTPSNCLKARVARQYHRPHFLHRNYHHFSLPEY
jgi:hypothetical protein